MSGARDAAGRWEGQAVETAVGIGLIVISALMIWFIIRTVSANMKR